MFKNLLNKFLKFLNNFLIFKKIFNQIKLIDEYKVISINYKKLYLLDSNLVTNYRIKTFFDKEPETISWINSFENNTIFWDIGANVGLYSLYSQFIKKNIETVSFEPSVLNLDILVKNIFKNNLQEKIFLVSNPIYDKPVFKNFKLSTLEKGGANSSFADLGIKRNELLSYKTNSLSLENIIALYKLDSPNYVKIDVDGNEVDILKSLFKIIHNIKSLLIEVNYNKNEIEKILIDNNFKNIFKSKKRNNQIWEKS